MKVLSEKKRFNVLDCGRRWGKTILGQDLAAEVALAGHPVGWFAPEYKYLTEVWRELGNALESYITRSNTTERRIELVTGGTIEMWSLDGGNAGRSRKYARIVVDEAALVPNLVSVWGEALRATLADLRGDAWFLSTPRGRNGFWELYQHGLDPLETEWACWQLPTSENPFIDPDEIEAARRGLPERIFGQEYLAEFLEDSAVFRKIRESATAEEQRYKDYNTNHQYIIGTDFGKYEDFSVFTVIDVTTGELCYMDRSNKIDYVVQVERLKALVKRFDAYAVGIETNGNATLIELLRKEKVPIREFTTTNASKQEIIEALMLAFEQGKLRILDDPVLVGELQSFEATRLPGGSLRYAAPAGYHDDCVMSLAIGWNLAKVSKPVTVQKRNSRKYRDEVRRRRNQRPGIGY